MLVRFQRIKRSSNECFIVAIKHGDVAIFKLSVLQYLLSAAVISDKR